MVFADPEVSTTLSEMHELSGDDVLPGFRLSIRQLFSEPQPSQDRQIRPLPA